MPITYPLDTNKTYTLYDTVNSEVYRAGIRWPNDDGSEIADLSANLAVLLEVHDPKPAYDPDTQKLERPAPAYDFAAGTVTFGYSVVALTQEELDEVAYNQNKQAQGQNVRNKIASLRQWADDAEGTTVTAGNTVSVLQTVVNRLGVFFDTFADYIESIDP